MFFNVLIVYTNIEYTHDETAEGVDMFSFGHNTLFLSLLLLIAPVFSMKKDAHISSQPLRLQLFTAIKDNDTQEVAQLLAHGAKIKIKAKKN